MSTRPACRQHNSSWTAKFWFWFLRATKKEEKLNQCGLALMAGSVQNKHVQARAMPFVECRARALTGCYCIKVQVRLATDTFRTISWWIITSLQVVIE